MEPADVVPLEDLSPAGWLREELVGFGGRVGEVVPTTGYEAIARVLHRDVGPDTEPGLWARIAAFCGTTLHPLAQYRMLAGLDPRSVAARPWPESTAPIPEVGSADRGSLTVLRDVLERHTGAPDRCWFALWKGWGGLPDAWHAAPSFALPGRDHHLFAGALADVVEISVEFGGSLRSPNLWWPDDRAWCVASEIDFDSTLVAGPAALVAELVGRPDLEAFEVAPGDSLQIDGDRVNMR